MSAEQRDIHAGFRQARVVAGCVGTIGWLMFWVWWTFIYPEGYWKMPLLGANEWGDWAAGTFAPLAFLWLVVGYFQQGDELAQNTQELRNSAIALRLQEQALQAQVAELKASVNAQQELVEATRRQADASTRASKVAATAKLLSYQPKFEVLSKPNALKGGRLFLSLKNTGHDVQDAEVRVEGTPHWEYVLEKVKVETDELGDIRHGREVSIKLDLTDPEWNPGKIDDWIFSVWVRYLDGLQWMQIIRLEIVFRDQQPRVIVHRWEPHFNEPGKDREIRLKWAESELPTPVQQSR